MGMTYSVRVPDQTTVDSVMDALDEHWCPPSEVPDIEPFRFDRSERGFHEGPYSYEDADRTLVWDISGPPPVTWYYMSSCLSYLAIRFGERRPFPATERSFPYLRHDGDRDAFPVVTTAMVDRERGTSLRYDDNEWVAVRDPYGRRRFDPGHVKAHGERGSFLFKTLGRIVNWGMGAQKQARAVKTELKRLDERFADRFGFEPIDADTS